MSQNLTGIIAWLKNWFYDKDEFDEIIESIPIDDTITTLTLVPYAENPNGVICYETPTPIPVDNVTLVSDKSILSAYDSDTATLSATVLDENNQPLSDISVEFFKDNASLGSVDTNDNGIATKTYSATGDGDVSITAECDSVSSTAITIEDCLYFNDGSSVGSLEVGSNVSCTSNGSYITITTSTSGEKYVTLPVILVNNDNWVFEVQIADTGTTQPLALNHDNASKWFGHSISGNQWFCNSGTNDTYTQAYQVGDTLALHRENGVDTCILNNSITVSNRSASHNSTFKVGFYTNRSRVQKVKNIKLKSL